MTEKKISTKLLLKTSFWYTISNFLTHAMVFLTMPIFTRLMSKTEYGDFSVYSNWQQMLVIICGFEVSATLNRARFDFQNKELDGYITSCLFLTTIITGLLFVSYMVFPEILGRWFLLDRKYMMIMFAYLFTFPAFSMFLVKQRIEYKYKLSAAISFAISILSSIIALLLVMTLESDRLFGRIVGQYILTILAGIILYIFFIHNSRSVQKRYCKYAIRIGLPLVFSFLSSRILLTSDTIVLKHMCTAEEVSNLSVSHSASHIVLLFVQTLNLAPWFYDMLKLNEHRNIRKVFRIYLWTVTAVTFCVLLIGPEVIQVLGGAKYKESVYLLPPYIICGIFTVLTAQFGSLETYYKKPEYAAILTGIVAILNVGLDILGVKVFGYIAVCYATVICQIILIILHYNFTKKMKAGEILTVKTLVATLVSAVILIPMALLLYTNSIMRYIFIGLMAVSVLSLIFINRHKIVDLIRKFKRSKNNITTEEEQSYE